MNGKAKPRFNTKEDYGDNWDELRLYVLKRDGYRCQIAKIRNWKCSGHYPPPFQSLLHAHHVVPLPKGPNHPKNLITLCNECHGKLHGRYLGKISDKQKRAARSA